MNTFIIMHYDTGEYWNIDSGWTEHPYDADRFNDTEHDAFTLPMDGYWVCIELAKDSGK